MAICWMGGFCLLVELHREGSAPAVCRAGFFLSKFSCFFSTYIIFRNLSLYFLGFLVFLVTYCFSRYLCNYPYTLRYWVVSYIKSFYSINLRKCTQSWIFYFSCLINFKFKCLFLANPAKARSFSINTSVNNWLIN